MVATLVLEASAEMRESSSLSSRTKVLFQSSTAVVQLTVNQLVVGSIPASGASIGGLVIMGAHVLCKHEVGVRSSHPPPCPYS
jgi:hypothetical protein